MELKFYGPIMPKASGEHKTAEKEVSVVGDGRYTIGACIGRGHFSRVYEGAELLRPQYKVAIKAQNPSHHRRIAIAEREVMTRLKGGVGIPKLLWSGTTMECRYHLIVMELLGPSLRDLLPTGEDYMNDMGFSIKTVARIGLQMISRLEFVHGHGIVHRDVKPDNMLMGRDANCNTLFLTDYGLSDSWVDSNTGYHLNAKPVLPAANKSITGTLSYCSVNVHQGQVYSRRDDLISLCYSLVYLRTAWLPWVGIKADTKTAVMDMILEKKLSCTADVLCANLPVDFMRFVSACFNMGFSEQPDYRHLSSMIYSVAGANHSSTDIEPWDWQLAGAVSQMAEKASGYPMGGFRASRAQMNMQWMDDMFNQDRHEARVQQQETEEQRRTGTDIPILREQSAPPSPGSRKWEMPLGDLVAPVTGGLLKKGYQKLAWARHDCTPPSSSHVLPKLSDKATVGCLPRISSLLRSRPPVQKVAVVTQPRKYETVV